MAHLAGKGFAGSPRPLGFDARGREVLTFLAGETVGSARPWPGWVYAEDTATQVARWMRRAAAPSRISSRHRARCGGWAGSGLLG